MCGGGPRLNRRLGRVDGGAELVHDLSGGLGYGESPVTDAERVSEPATCKMGWLGHASDERCGLVVRVTCDDPAGTIGARNPEGGGALARSWCTEDPVAERLYSAPRGGRAGPRELKR